MIRSKFRSRRRLKRRARIAGGRLSRRRPMTVGKVKRIIDAELKVQDSNVSRLATPSVGGFRVHLTNIDVGDSNDERTGNWIKPTALMGTVVMIGDAAQASILSRFKVYVVQWRESDDLNPATNEKIVQDSTNPHQQFNIESKGQFKILWSWNGFVLNNPDNSQFAKMKRFYVKPPRKVLYDDDVFKKEHLFIFAYSDQALNPPLISYGIRLRYTDS